MSSNYDGEKLVVPDVEPFTPDQISVSVTEEGHLVVRATHEEKDEGDGTISRKYIIDALLILKNQAFNNETFS